MKALHFMLHLFLGLAIVSGIGLIVMSLWNWLIPLIWGWTVINFWQALGLFVLCRMLFGDFWGERSIFAFGGHPFHKNHIRKKWMKMTPEEQKEFIRKRHSVYGFGHFTSDSFNREESEKRE
jgi:hypothetical protein